MYAVRWKWNLIGKPELFVYVGKPESFVSGKPGSLDCSKDGIAMFTILELDNRRTFYITCKQLKYK